MRTTRLAAAGAAAAIALGGTVAAASTTGEQTVTITVEALARSVTTGGDATLTITAGAAGSTAVVTGSPTIAYTNGADGEAQITAALTAIGEGGVTQPNWDAGLEGLSLSVTLPEAANGQTETNPTQQPFNMGGMPGLEEARVVLTGIPESVERAATGVSYQLAGTAPSTTGDTELTITFTIQDQPAPPQSHI